MARCKNAAALHYYDLLLLATHDETVSADLLEDLFVRGHQLCDANIAQHPQEGLSYLTKAYLYHIYAQWKDVPVDPQAYELAFHVMEMTPTRIDAHNALAHLYLADHETEQAFEIASQAYELAGDRQPDTMWLYAQIGYMLSEDAAQYAPIAYHVIQYEIDASLNNAGTILWIIDYYIERNDLQVVKDIYERVAQKYPSSTQFLPNLAATYAALGQYDDARATAERLRTLDPSQAEAADAFLAELPE